MCSGVVVDVVDIDVAVVVVISDDDVVAVVVDVVILEVTEGLLLFSLGENSSFTILGSASEK